MEEGRLELTSVDIAEDRRQQLLRLFPEARTEGGKIDFARLSLALGETIDVGKERYGMNWPGKADCFKTIQSPSLGTLRPAREESIDFDTTENLIIEGDNLEVLKLLQKSYAGKVKMIYIDPPYNTGNDFIYPDNFSESLQTYLEYTGQVDAQGKKWSTNTEADGRFHSKWLNMIYSRLYLARNLLREDGVIFVSIDDREIDNLRRVANEIFGEDSFLACAVWQKRTSPDARTALGAAHDYIVCYVRTPTDKKSPLNQIPLTAARTENFKNPDNDKRGPWASVDLTGQTGHATDAQYFKIKTPAGIEYGPPKGRCWAIAESTFLQLEKEKRIWFGKDGDSRPRLKQYLAETTGMSTWTWWPNDEVGHNQEATKDLIELLDDPDVFDNPKPTRLIRRMLELATQGKNSDIILDFFGGSGTTAHAVLDLNKHDNGNRKFILVQLPEPTSREDFPTIADICKERVRRVVKKLNESDDGKLPLESDAKPDRGFRVFKLAESNFETWKSDVPHGDSATLAKQLELYVDHVRHERLPEDLLYEILLKSGFPLTTPVEVIKIAGKTIYSVAEGALLVCLERELTLECIREMAEKRPERVVCLDAGFSGDDQLKANAAHNFKAKGIKSFKTV